MVSISASVMDARRRRGQYSHIWESQRIRRILAASWSDSETNWLKLGVWDGASSSELSRVGLESSCTR